MKFITRRILKNKPYFFVASEKDAWRVNRLILRVQLARFFHCSPFEFERIPERKLREMAAVVAGIIEVEEEDRNGNHN